MKKNFTLFLTLLLASAFHINSYAEPQNLGRLKEELRVYHDSGAHEKEIAAVIHRAELYVDAQVKANQRLTHPKKLAIVLDIDETSLSNYDVMAKHDFSMSKKQFQVTHLKAQIPAIKPMLAFYHHVTKEGVAVFFVTGRLESFRLATEKNLKAAGFDHWAGLYLKPESYQQPSAYPFKSSTRAEINRLGYEIVASIGDQNSDLIGGFTMKTYKLPNPFYFIP